MSAKASAKRQPRRGWRAPAPPTREVRLAPCASGLGQCPAHPIIRAHVATRRPKTTAREGRWLQPPFFPSCCPPRPCPRVAWQGVCPVRLANCAACSHTLNQASWHQDGARFNVWQRLWHSYRPNGDVPRAAWQAPLTSPSIAWPPRRPSVHMFSFVHDSVWHLVSFRRTPCRQRPVAGSGHGILMLGDKPFFLRGGVLLRVLRAARTRARHITPADVEQMGNSRYARSTSCITMWRYWIRKWDRDTIVVLRV